MTTISVGEAREFVLSLSGHRDDEARWPRYRYGPREPIPWQIRVAVYQRDGKRCLSCGKLLDYKEAQLDHIVPWSAYGPDRSSNLRILCKDCNEDRSNFRGSLDTWNARRQPVTFNCVSCLEDEWEYCYSADNELCEGLPEMVSAYCVYCGLVSRTWLEEVF